MLYLTYWGALDPLGRSLVVPALLRLSAAGVRFTLVTFEKRDQMARSDAVGALRAEFTDAGVTWLPLRYHKRPRVPATAYDVGGGAAQSVVAALRHRVDIIHARTFVAGLMGLGAATLLRIPWIYHNEGFYPDEQVDAGVWTEGSTPHRIASRLERTLYRRADEIFLLSESSIPRIRALAPTTSVTVVPSAVDLRRFGPGAVSWERDQALGIVYVGSVGGRYRLDLAARFVKALAAEARVAFRVITPMPRNVVERELIKGGLTPAAVEIGAAPFEEIPRLLSGAHVGIHFLGSSIASRGGSPTKVGEYLAAGLPVVLTAGIGDTEQEVRTRRIGEIVDDISPEGLASAARRLVALLTDAQLPARCRDTAETRYSLDVACERQLRVYHRLTGHPE